MKLKDLAHAIEARLLPGSGNPEADIRRVYAGATMSDLIAHAASDTLIVTTLNNAQLARVAELMDVPCLCLVNGTVPSPELLAAATGAGASLMVSVAGIEATARSLHEVLRA
jgi:hypothetical protein